MGHNFALDIQDFGISLEDQIAMHLTGNHYPPIPTSMVPPCIEAITAFYADDNSRPIDLPDGITYRGLTTAPAYAIIEQHHLHSWVVDEEYEDE